MSRDPGWSTYEERTYHLASDEHRDEEWCGTLCLLLDRPDSEKCDIDVMVRVDTWDTEGGFVQGGITVTAIGTDWVHEDKQLPGSVLYRHLDRGIEITEEHSNDP